MKYLILSLAIAFHLLGCKETPAPAKYVSVPEDFIIYSDEDSVVCDIQTFIKQHDKTMFALYNSDCSACIVGLSLWFNFAKEHPELTPVLSVYTEQSKRVFWLQNYTYYPAPIYAFFDKEFKFFLANKIQQQHDTFIVDSTGKIIVEGSIRDEKFKKDYLKYLKKQGKK